MKSEFVQIAVEDGIAWMTLNEPARLNPVSLVRIEEINDAVADLGRRDDVRVIAVTGAGRGFCSGADLADEELRSVDRYFPASGSFLSSLTGWTLASTSQPVVAMINGAAIGFGLELALQADIRIAGESARMGFPYVQMGGVTDTGAATWILPRLIGHDRAAELLLTGEFIDGRRAAEIGLVARVVADEDLREVTRALCAKIAAGHPAAVQALKQMLVRGQGQSAAEHLLMQYEYMNKVRPDLSRFATRFAT